MPYFLFQYQMDYANYCNVIYMLIMYIHIYCILWLLFHASKLYIFVQ